MPMCLPPTPAATTPKTTNSTTIAAASTSSTNEKIANFSLLALVGKSQVLAIGAAAECAARFKHFQVSTGTF